MTTPFEQMQEKSVGEFSSDSANYIRSVHSTKQPILITDAGEQAAVILDSHEFHVMEERLQLLEDIYLAQEQLRAGKGLGHDGVSDQLLSRFPG